MLAEGLLPDKFTYSTMVDACALLITLYTGKAGQLAEGELLINNTEVRESAGVWQALLGACKAHNDVDRGRRVAERIIQLDPLVCAAYVALSDFL
ncbi:hypothetical protein GOP47_0029075 [Adiantum capillus-veneris]|nr:hypothetical protein GOP47_0029075 [Adiantum capillus-veneris]